MLQQREHQQYDKQQAVPSEIQIYIKSFFGFRNLIRSFFVSAQVCDSRNWNSRPNSFVRAPPSGGGSNAPRPAVSVPHIDVNAHGCRARQAKSCKNTACRGGMSEILVASLCLQRLDDLQNWHHFQMVLDNVLNFAVAFSRALASLLYFFTSSFGFLLGLYCFCFCSFCQLERQFFSVGSPKT